jgi:hypothetical protein
VYAAIAVRTCGAAFSYATAFKERPLRMARTLALDRFVRDLAEVRLILRLI